MSKNNKFYRRRKTIVQEHEANFNTLRTAFVNDDVCLMDCIERSTGEHVAVICAVAKAGNEETTFTPFARFFNGNPYELLINPDDPEYATFDMPKFTPGHVVPDKPWPKK
jgi:hypothetical protein